MPGLPAHGEGEYCDPPLEADEEAYQGIKQGRNTRAYQGND